MIDFSAIRQVDQIKEHYGWVFEYLQQNQRLKVLAIVVVMLLCVTCVYNPMNDRISSLRTRLTAERARLSLVRAVEGLRAERHDLLASIPETAHTNFWTEYVLEGLRESGVRLRHFDTDLDTKQQIGEYRPLEIALDVSGSYQQLYALLGWIESNQWYMRVLDLRFRKDSRAIFATLKIGVLAWESNSDAHKL